MGARPALVDALLKEQGRGGSDRARKSVKQIRVSPSPTRFLEEPTVSAGRLEQTLFVTLPVAIIAGQPDQIEFEIWGKRAPGGAHLSEGTGHIRFNRLEPRVSVTSCQGFEGHLPVSARAFHRGHSRSMRSVSSKWPVSSLMMFSSCTWSPLSPNASACFARLV